MLAAELIAPIGYGTGWLLLGVALLVAVIVSTGVLVFARGRSRWRSGVASADPGLKERYHSQIDDIEKKFNDGSVAAREAHLRLSAVVRSFGRDMSGLNAPVMTLTELRQTPLPEVASAVEEYYPASFEQAESAGIETAVARARWVIESWH